MGVFLTLRVEGRVNISGTVRIWMRASHVLRDEYSRTRDQPTLQERLEMPDRPGDFSSLWRGDLLDAVRIVVLVRGGPAAQRQGADALRLRPRRAVRLDRPLEGVSGDRDAAPVRAPRDRAQGRTEEDGIEHTGRERRAGARPAGQPRDGENRDGAPERSVQTAVA